MIADTFTMIGRTLGDLPDPQGPFLAHFPEVWRPVISSLLSLTPILLVFPMLFALTTVLERKGLARIQNRRGPNRVGPAGFLQFAADGLKTLTKEDVVPRAADRWVHFLAPLMLVVPVLLTYSVIPFGKNLVALRMDTGLLFFFALGAFSELAVFMAGWSSRNKYSLLGAMRAVAQMISYEVPLILSAIAVVMVTGSLSLVTIVEAQVGTSGWPAWNVFTPWGCAGFLIFLVAACAEANRSPFDLPEGESEIIAGYYLEYSGFKFALFFLGEYLGLFAASSVGIALFLGGWAAPLPLMQGWLPGWVWFLSKLALLMALFIWVRGTLPRVRMDQLMGLAWKFLLPMSVLNIGMVMIWHHWGPGWGRWILTSAVLLGAYWGLGRMLFQAARIERRRYRYAEDVPPLVS